MFLRSLSDHMTIRHQPRRPSLFFSSWRKCLMDACAPLSEDVLLQLPWLPVSISGCRLLTKTWFGETAYRVLLTDMHSLWEERMDTADIQSRAQELNRRLRASVGAFFSHLREVAQPCLSGGGGPAQVSLTRQEGGGVSVRLKSELAGLPFYWQFHCSPAPGALVCGQLVRPLLVMSGLLQQQVQQLGALLARKDAEIQDYRENGATLSRERLQTAAFQEKSYTEEFMAKTLPLLWSGRSDALGFTSDLQRLYGAAVAQRTAAKRKLSEERQEHGEEEEERPGEEERLPVTDPPDVGTDDSEPADGRNQNQNQNGPVETCRPPAPQPVSSGPAERASSKPKKKKVGLFR